MNAGKDEKSTWSENKLEDVASGRGVGAQGQGTVKTAVDFEKRKEDGHEK